MRMRERPFCVATLGGAFGSALLAVLLSASLVQGQESRTAHAANARAEWRLQHPIVLGSAEVKSERESLTLFPLGVVWLDGVPVVAAVKGYKESPILMFWTERADRSWAPYATIPHISFPLVRSIGGKAIGVVGSVGADVRGAYGSAVHFLRIQDGKPGEPHVLASPSNDVTRVTIGAMEVSGDTIFVFLLRENRDPPRNELLLAVSRDGGLSWSDTRTIGETTMGEDASHMRALCFSDRHLARFLFERAGVFLHRTRDAGETWEKEPFRVEDGLGETMRMPLGVLMSRGEAGVVYMALNPGNQGNGGYFFTRSSDEGKSWSKGVPITPSLKLDDPSSLVNVTSVGDRIAFSYIEIVGSWTQGEITNRIAVSQDNGKTWAQEPVGKYYNGAMMFTALSGAPDGSRILYSTVVRATKGEAPRCYLVVQEYSGRSGRTAAKVDPAVLDRLIAELGDQEYKVREAASESLAALGASARQGLLKAAGSADAEVAARAKELIGLLFPDCLNLTPEE